MSPDSAGMFTWTTSWEEKMAYKNCERYAGLGCAFRADLVWEDKGELELVAGSLSITTTAQDAGCCPGSSRQESEGGHFGEL